MIFKRKTSQKTSWKAPRKAARPLITSQRRVFHGVAINLGATCACDAVLRLADIRFLADEAPRLPLGDCSTPMHCACTYVHFKDRRTEPRRECDMGLPIRDVAADQRQGSGRRVTDF